MMEQPVVDATPVKYNRDYQISYYNKNKLKIREKYYEKKRQLVEQKSKAYKAFLEQDVEKEWTLFLKHFKENQNI